MRNTLLVSHGEIAAKLDKRDTNSESIAESRPCQEQQTQEEMLEVLASVLLPLRVCDGSERLWCQLRTPFMTTITFSVQEM